MADKQKVKCNVCGKAFDSKKQLEQHKQDAHSKEIKSREIIKPIRRFKFSKTMIALIGIVALAAIIGGVMAYSATKPHASTTLTALPIDGIQCNTLEQLVFHIHAHLDIFINGQPHTVPQQIGIVPNKCIYWIHTHDNTGVIHIESPVNRDYTLGQFFDIWHEKFNNTQIFDNIASSKNSLSVYINGTKVPSETNFKNIKLNAHDEIAIIYGTRPNTIPSTYNFPEGE